MRGRPLRAAALTGLLLLAIGRVVYPQGGTQSGATGSGDAAQSQPIPPGDPALQAALADALAAFNAHQWGEAKTRYQTLVDLAREQHDELWEARGLLGVGSADNSLAQYAEAKTTLSSALAVFRRLSYTRGIAQASAVLGHAEAVTGQTASAIEHYTEAHAAYQAVGDRQWTVVTAYDLFRLQPTPNPMDEPYAKLLADARDVGDKELEGDILHDWGDELFNADQFEPAVEKLDAAAAVFEGLPDSARELGTVYNSLGRLYRAHGQPGAALQCQLKALALHEKSHEQFFLMQSTNAVAVTYQALGDSDHARQYYDRALALAEGTGSENILAFLRGNYGSFLISTGDAARGLALLEQSLPQAGRYTALRYSEMSDAQRMLGHLPEALAATNHALELCASSTVERSTCVGARIDKSSIELAMGDEAAALRDQKAVVQEIEDRQRQLAASDFLKQGFAQYSRPAYSLAVELELRHGDTSDALETAELARSRAFVDLLASRTTGTAAHPAPASLTLRGSAAAMDLRNDADVQPPTVQELTAIAARLNSTMVLYWVGNDAVFAWVLSSDGTLKSSRVPLAQHKLDALVRAVSAFAPPLGAQKAVVTTRGASAIPLAVRKQPAWTELYNVLIKPIEGDLPRKAGARLTIVPHGPLLNVPFAALRDAQGRYLIERYAIHTVPAPGMLRYTAAKTPAGARSGSVLLVADPLPAPKISGEPALPRLPGASAEARAIAGLFPAAHTTLLAGANATEPRVEAAVADKSVIHFATHAIVRDSNPLGSFLALGVPRDGSANGQLSADKIYALRLSADLVVLSACRSGGGVISGDGIAGLARAFFYAGSASLMVSLWDVADEPTNRLLPAFYRAWLAGADKARALRAAQLQLIADLRAGRVKVSTPAGDIVIPEDPAFWAGFVLIGEPD